MEVTLKVHGKPRKTKTEKKTIEELLKKRGVCTESVLVKRNEKFVPVEDKLREGDVLEIIEIVSRG